MSKENYKVVSEFNLKKTHENKLENLKGSAATIGIILGLIGVKMLFSNTIDELSYTQKVLKVMSVDSIPSGDTEDLGNNPYAKLYSAKVLSKKEPSNLETIRIDNSTV